MIAIADDDAPVRRAVVRLLRSAGYSSCSFASGQEVLKHCVAERPDCLVLDLQMPDISGVQLQRMLHSAGVFVPIIVITASDETRMLDDCLAEGATACLRKPLDDEKLLAAVERAIRIPPAGATQNEALMKMRAPP